MMVFSAGMSLAVFKNTKLLVSWFGFPLSLTRGRLGTRFLSSLSPSPQSLPLTALPQEAQPSRESDQETEKEKPEKRLD
jgi:hypothetical protein